MARPQKNNVEYFPHYISDGKKMFYIEQKYGNDGYASWFKILETLAKTDHHWINLNEETELMFLASKCRISEETLINLLEDLSKLDQINSEMWANKIIWSDKFIESISDAYVKRSNECMNIEGLRSHLMGLGILKEPVKPQSIVKEIKVKESKEKKTKTFLMSEANASNISEKNKGYFEIAKSFYSLFELNAEKLGVKWAQLEKAKAETFIDPIRLLVESDNRTIDDIRHVWTFLSKDEFWRPNIQSTKKLREKFDQLITKAKNGEPTSKNRTDWTQQAHEYLTANSPNYKNM